MTARREIMRHCMSVGYVRNSHAKTEDALVVKERIRDVKTGREKPHLRIVPNFKRKWWITKKGIQAEHEQKREYEFLENLDEFESTDAEMPFRINSVLGRPCGNFPKMGDLCKSPYVYGTDIKAPVLYKAEQDDANAKVNGEWMPDYSLAVADYETNTHSDAEEIITGAISFKKMALIVATESFMSGIVNPEVKMQEITERYLQKEIIERDMQVKYLIVKDDMHVVRAIMGFAHTHKPDFLTFWNMNFDINKTLDSCKRHNVDPAHVFCAPEIPAQYRSFRWQEDRPNSVTASGKKKNKDPSETWNVVHAPASFYIIDAMCVFRMLRVIEGKRRSYGLDAILGEETDVRKLEIPGVEGNHNLLWHRKMQRDMKPEYCAYNLFDCISVEILDEKTGDLAKKVSLYADGSEFSTLSSNPKRLANSIHVFLLKQGKVLCSTSSNMTEDLDKYVLDKVDWIVTLANELADQTGLAIFKERPELLTRIVKDVADIDITSGYPTAHSVANVAKSTTLAEISAIKGLSKAIVKQVAVNMMAVPANSVDIGQKVLNLPGLYAIEKMTRGCSSLSDLEAVFEKVPSLRDIA